ncbi:MAG: hypothetical protein ABIA37_01320 [Candidatus Woesearchaeota archaeon]
MNYFEISYDSELRQPYRVKGDQLFLYTTDFTDCLRFFFKMNSIHQPIGKVQLKLNGKIPRRERKILEDIVCLYNRLPLHSTESFHKNYKDYNLPQ